MAYHRELVGVFGANGFIGRALVDRLIRNGQPTVVFGRTFPPEFWGPLANHVEMRVIDFKDRLSTLASMQDLTSVVQLINNSSPSIGNTNLIDDVEANVLPHIGFVESCLRANVRKIVFVSSGGTVYGEPKYYPLDEAHPTMPINSYGLTKLMVEQYIRLICRTSDIQYAVLRLSNPYGPGQMFKKGQGLVAAILSRLVADEAIEIHGDGSAVRDYIHITDVVDALLAALRSPVRDTYNIGSGVGRTVLDVVHAVEDAVGKKLAVEFIPQRNTDAMANVLDCTKARLELGWEPKVAFDVGMKETVQTFLRSH